MPAEQLDRRARRRQETIEEILDIATEIMAEEGVNGMSLSEIARRLGVQPPSIYKYFPSLMAIYDALFERGSRAHVAVMRDAMADAPPGLAALRAGLDAAGRWSIENQATAQLLFWRPVPSFEPSADAYKPSQEMVAIQRAALADAVRLGELGEAALADDTIYLISTMIAGVFGQGSANEPDKAWGKGQFNRWLPTLLDCLPTIYPPTPARRKAKR